MRRATIQNVEYVCVDDLLAGLFAFTAQHGGVPFMTAALGSVGLAVPPITPAPEPEVEAVPEPKPEPTPEADADQAEKLGPAQPKKRPAKRSRRKARAK